MELFLFLPSPQSVECDGCHIGDKCTLGLLRKLRFYSDSYFKSSGVRFLLNIWQGEKAV